MKVKEQMPATATPRELIEKWTPGILGDGSELAKTIAIYATTLLIEHGAIPEARETRAFMKWHRETYLPSIQEDDDDPSIEGVRMHAVTDDDGNLLIGQRGDGSPIWDDAENPLPLQRAAHFTEFEARCKAWELAGAGYGPTGIAKLHHA